MITMEFLIEHDACHMSDPVWVGHAKAWIGDGRTLLDVLRCEEIAAADRVWVATLPDALSPRLRRLFAGDCADRALARVVDPDPRSVEAVRVARLHANGLASDEQIAAARDEARDAAWSAASAAARAAASAAARAAARDEERDAAWSAASAAARAAAWSAARAAARDEARDEAMDEAMDEAIAAEREEQVADLIRLIEPESVK